MKTIVLSENKYNKLFSLQEDAKGEFSLAELNSIKADGWNTQGFDDRIMYCKKYLGNPIGKGSSRMTFAIGDDTVIKLVKNKGQIFQNEGEYKIYSSLSKKYDFFPKVYQHAEDFSWIICERVVPFSHEDCIVLLGIPYSKNMQAYFDDYRKAKSNYSDYMNPKQVSRDYYDDMEFDDDKYDVDISLVGFIDWAERKAQTEEETYDFEDEIFGEWIKENKWFEDLASYIDDVGGFTDLFDNNFGLAMRNGKPYIVILDSGYDEYFPH